MKQASYKMMNTVLVHLHVKPKKLDHIETENGGIYEAGSVNGYKMLLIK